jgi:hypothetical protein
MPTTRELLGDRGLFHPSLRRCGSTPPSSRSERFIFRDGLYTIYVTIKTFLSGIVEPKSRIRKAPKHGPSRGAGPSVPSPFSFPHPTRMANSASALKRYCQGDRKRDEFTDIRHFLLLSNWLPNRIAVSGGASLSSTSLPGNDRPTA